MELGQLSLPHKRGWTMARLGVWGLCLVAMLATLAGCAAEAPADPENDRLDTGQFASLFSGQSDHVPLLRSEKMEMVPVGTRVEIVDDSAPEPEKEHRKTMVTVREGPHKGMAGRVFRDSLRPVAASQGTASVFP
jgi:hypothetical protein